MFREVRQRDIVLMPVPISDLTTVKKRPVLILSNTPYNDSSEDFLCAAITSNLRQKPYGITITSEDLEEGLLPMESRIRADKVYSLSRKLILKRFATLKKKPFEKALKELNSLIEAQ